MSADLAVLSTAPVLFAVLFSGALIVYKVLFRAARLRPEPWYVSELALSAFLVPPIVVMIATAVALLGDMLVHIESAPPSALSLLVAAGVIGVAVVVAVLIARATPREERHSGAEAPTMTVTSEPPPKAPPLPRAA